MPLPSVYVTDGQLRAEGIKALTLAQAQQLMGHNLDKVAHLLEQNKHLQVRFLTPRTRVGILPRVVRVTSPPPPPPPPPHWDPPSELSVVDSVTPPQAHIDKVGRKHVHEDVHAPAPAAVPVSSPHPAGSAPSPPDDKLSVTSIASSAEFEEPAPAPAPARPHTAAHDMGRHTRLLNRLEAAFKRFHFKSPIEDWEQLTTDELEAAVVKAECVAEVIELEHHRRVGHPTTRPFFTEPPKMSDPDAKVAELDAKVRALWTLYRLVENPKIARLRLQAYNLDVTRDAALLEEVQPCAVNVCMPCDRE